MPLRNATARITFFALVLMTLTVSFAPPARAADPLSTEAALDSIMTRLLPREGQRSWTAEQRRMARDIRRAIAPLARAGEDPASQNQAVDAFWDSLGRSRDLKGLVPGSRPPVGSPEQLLDLVSGLVMLAGAAACIYFGVAPLTSLLLLGALGGFLQVTKNQFDIHRLPGRQLDGITRTLATVDPAGSTKPATWGNVAAGLNTVRESDPAASRLADYIYLQAIRQDPRKRIDPGVLTSGSASATVPALAHIASGRRDGDLSELAADALKDASPGNGADAERRLNNALQRYQAEVVRRYAPALECDGDGPECVRRHFGRDRLLCIFALAAERRGFDYAVYSKFAAPCRWEASR